MNSPLEVVPPTMLYPLPNILPTNMLHFRCTGEIKDTWVIDTRLKIPKIELNLMNNDEADAEARANVDLESKNGGGVVAKLYIVPSASPLFSLGFNVRAVTIRAKSHQGDVKLTIVSRSAH